LTEEPDIIVSKKWHISLSKVSINIAECSGQCQTNGPAFGHIEWTWPSSSPPSSGDALTRYGAI